MRFCWVILVTEVPDNTIGCKAIWTKLTIEQTAEWSMTDYPSINSERFWIYSGLLNALATANHIDDP